MYSLMRVEKGMETTKMFPLIRFLKEFNYYVLEKNLNKN